MALSAKKVADPCTRQNHSLTLNHVKYFPLFCHCYSLIFKYDLYYLLKPVKICSF